MELVLGTKKIIVVILAFALMASAIVYLALPESNDSYDGKRIGEEGLDGMSWSDIMAEARGQSVNLSYYPDEYNQRFFDEALIPAAKNYGINVTYGPDLGYIGAMNDADAMKSGGQPKYDMYWMGVSGYMAFKDSVWWTEDWKSVVPNTMLLPDGTDAQVSYALYGDATKYVGNQIEFSGGQLVFFYNNDLESPDIEYNQVTLKVGSGAKKTYTLATDGADTFVLDMTTPVKSSALTAYLKTLNSGTYDVQYGLPNNYSELFEWAKIWPGQFTYINPHYSSTSYYIGYSFVYGAIYELDWASKGPNTGWAKYSGDIKARAATVDNDLAALWTEANGDGTEFNKLFERDFGYLYAYLDDIDGYVMKVEGNAWYPKLSTELYQKMIGYRGNETIPQNGTAMLSYTVVTSQIPRLGDDNANAGFASGIYSMETSIMEQYDWTINKNSNSKAACLVIANLLLDPEMQAEWYRITGEITNLDLDKYIDLLGGVGSERYKAQYEKYFAFIDAWKAAQKEWAFIDPADLKNTAIDANPSKYYIPLGAAWLTKYG